MKRAIIVQGVAIVGLLCGEALIFMRVSALERELRQAKDVPAGAQAALPDMPARTPARETQDESTDRRSEGQSLYRSSVVGTDFDFILETDPDTFLRLEYKGQDLCEMPDKTGSGPLLQKAFLFESHYSDGTRVNLAIDADFGTEVEARQEALRYTPRLGKLPTALRSGVSRVVVHKGGADATAFSDVGLMVLYSENATKRIATHDLEETVFHESVHAAWDKAHAASPKWLEAQKADGAFVTEYARKNPKGEDLAESALFAYTLLHHPERIPADDAARIRKTIPARIAFVGTLLPPGKPIHYPLDAKQAQQASKAPSASCTVDLTNVGQLKDILSNALVLGLGQEEGTVSSFLADAKYSTADELTRAVADKFRLEEKAVRAAIQKYLHVNCSHSD
jgi:hypothetical protein